MAGPSEDDLGRFLQRVVLPPGWRILHEPTVTSTNDLARQAARRGWPDRSVFVADYQTVGRGQEMAELANLAAARPAEQQQRARIGIRHASG